MIKKLSKSIREYTTDTILTPILVIGEVFMEAIIPYNIALLVNEIRGGCGIDTIKMYGIRLIVLSVFSLIFGYAAGITCAKASTGFVKNLRKDVFNNIQKFSFSNIDNFTNASLVTRLTVDIQDIQMAFMVIIRMAIRSPLNLIFSFVMAYIMGGTIAIIFLIVIPILGVGLIMIAKKAIPIFRKGFPMYDALNNSVNENIKGIRVVKSFVREDFENEKFKERSKKLKEIFTKAELILAFNGPLMQFCMYAVMLFVLYFGSKMIITTDGAALDVGQFSTLLTYSFQILSSLMMLAMVFVMITFSEEAAVRVCEVLDEKSSIVSKENPIIEVNNGDIDFNNVYFKYSDKNENDILKNIDLHIKSGETIGIIGGTGSSKSSLVQLIPRLYDVKKGFISVGGVDVRDYDLKVLRDSVAMVLQKNILFSGTIIDNIKFGNKNATIDEVKEVCKLACADEFIEQMPSKYETYIEQGGTNVSGGQKQRLCIARALLKKPKVLILDDSTSAVDTKTDAIIRKSLKNYLPNTTKIIIAQRTSSVEDADRIIIMDNGEINQIGTNDELLRNNKIYREVYFSQNKKENDDRREEG